MFEHHFGLRENPFPAGHQLKFVYPSREHQEARAHLRYGIENREPFLLITGEVGTGKTTSLYDALNEWGDRVAVAMITNSSLTRQELLEEICLRFGMQMQPGISKPAALVMLEKHLVAVRARGEHAVLMMDEAQNLSMDLLEEIRLLSNLEHKGEKLLQIFLVGQPELEAHLARHELRQLRQRITVHYRLNPLSADETLGYIHHHIGVAGGNAVQVFPPDSCREIFRLTHGIPREINTLASSALIAAYADNSPSVSLLHIAAAASEGDFRSVLSSPRPEVAPEPARQAPAAPAPAPPPQARSAPPPSPAPQAPASPTAPWPQPPRPVREAPYSAPAPRPAPPEPEAESFPALREARGEVTKGLVAAMRRADPPPPPPPPAARPKQERARFASQPNQQSPTPLPLPMPADNRGMPQGDLSSLPPRLRARLERELSLEETGVSPMRNWLIAVSVLATLTIMLILMQRFGAIDVPFLRGAAGRQTTQSAAPDAAGELVSPTTEDPAAVVIDSMQRPQQPAPAVKTASTAPSVSQPTHTPVSAPDKFTASNETPVPPVHAAPDSAAASLANDTSVHYGVSVAAFLDADRARGERLRLSRDTTLPGVVVPFNDGGTTMYRVVLGRWSTSADAETAANALMERGLINEARVVQIPRR